MDLTAITLSHGSGRSPLVVFNLKTPGNAVRVIKGDDETGTKRLFLNESPIPSGIIGVAMPDYSEKIELDEPSRHGRCRRSAAEDGRTAAGKRIVAVDDCFIWAAGGPGCRHGLDAFL